MIYDLQTILALLGSSGAGLLAMFAIARRILHDARIIVDDLDTMLSDGKIDTDKISEIRNSINDMLAFFRRKK